MVRKDIGYNDKKRLERQLIEKGIGVTFAPGEKSGGGEAGGYLCEKGIVQMTEIKRIN